MIEINVMARRFIGRGISALVWVNGMLGEVINARFVEHEHLRRQEKNSNPINALMCPKPPSIGGVHLQRQQGGQT
jgi:hypothetical protein